MDYEKVNRSAILELVTYVLCNNKIARLAYNVKQGTQNHERA